MTLKVYLITHCCFSYFPALYLSLRFTLLFCCRSKNSTRKRKIENILHQAFPHKRRFDINCFDSESSGDEDIEVKCEVSLSNEFFSVTLGLALMHLLVLLFFAIEFCYKDVG